MVKGNQTPDFARTDASDTRCQREEDCARKAVRDPAVKAGKAYQKTQKDTNRLDMPKKHCVRMLVEP